MSAQNGLHNMYDTSVGLSVLNHLLHNPLLFDNNKYSLTTKDFFPESHQLLFSLMKSSYETGNKVLDIQSIETFVNGLTVESELWKRYNVESVYKEMLDTHLNENFDFYYNRLKKDSLIRTMQGSGMDMSWIYPSSTITDAELKTQMEREYQSLTLKELGEKIEQHFLYIKDSFLTNQDRTSNTYAIQEGYDELFDKLGQEPDMGLPLYGKYINTITRGARLGKLYIRSAASGVGKSAQ